MKKKKGNTVYTLTEDQLQSIVSNALKQATKVAKDRDSGDDPNASEEMAQERNGKAGPECGDLADADRKPKKNKKTKTPMDGQESAVPPEDDYDEDDDECLSLDKDEEDEDGTFSKEKDEDELESKDYEDEESKEKSDEEEDECVKAKKKKKEKADCDDDEEHDDDDMDGDGPNGSEKKKQEDVDDEEEPTESKKDPQRLGPERKPKSIDVSTDTNWQRLDNGGYMIAAHAVDAFFQEVGRKHGLGLHQFSGDSFLIRRDALLVSPYSSSNLQTTSKSVSDAIKVIKDAFGSKPGNAPEFRPTEDELNKINTLTLRPFGAHELKVFYTYSADTNLDMHNEHFHQNALQSMADKCFGAPYMKDHNHGLSDGVMGRVFEGKAIKGKNGGRLIQKFYMVDNPKNHDSITDLEAGVNSKLSVGVQVKRKDFHCDKCGKPMLDLAPGDGSESLFGYNFCGHMPGMEDKDGNPYTFCLKDVHNFMELSRVTIPAQPAAAVKSMNIESSNTSQKIQKSLETKISPRVSTVESKEVDEVLKALIGLTDTLKAQAEKGSVNTEAISSLVTVVDKLATKVDNQETKIEAWQSNFEKNLEADRACLNALLASQKSLIDNLGVRVNHSNEDIAKYVAASKLMNTDRVTHQNNYRQKAGDQEGFYEDVAQRF